MKPRRHVQNVLLKAKDMCEEAWGPFLESPDIFSGPENYFMCAMFTLKTQLLIVLKA